MFYKTFDSSSIFLINLKAGYSTFDKMRQKKLLVEEQTLDKDKNVKIYCVIRNPYNRFLSFYTDKFKWCFNGKQTDKNCDLQFCQTKIYQYFPKNKIRNLEFEIDDLIECIKNGYWDKHLDKQVNIINENNLSVEEIILLRMEDTHFNKNVKTIIGIDDIEIINSTTRIKPLLTNENKSFLYNLYKEDFIKFNYPI